MESARACACDSKPPSPSDDIRFDRSLATNNLLKSCARDNGVATLFHARLVVHAPHHDDDDADDDDDAARCEIDVTRAPVVVVDGKDVGKDDDNVCFG